MLAHALGALLLLLRRRGAAVALAVAPVALWLLLFSSGVALLPARARPPVNTTLLPRLDGAIGYSFRWFDCRGRLRPLLDLLAALPYTVHPVLPLLYVAVVSVLAAASSPSSLTSSPSSSSLSSTRWPAAARPRILTFVFVFGVMNVCAVLTHLLVPTAPPWYFDKFGTAPASYDSKGDPAVLARVDELLNIQFFTRMYRDGGKVVFGAWPSLHAAWPYLMYIFRPAPASRVVHTCMGLYIVWVWWAAMYLHHHYLLDLLGGALYAQLAYMFAIPKDRKGNQILDPVEEEPLLPVTIDSKRPVD